MSRRTIAVLLAAAVAGSAVRAQSAFQAGFETPGALPAGWTSQGRVAIDQETAFKGSGSLRLERSPEDVEKPCTVTSAAFALSSGVWRVDVAVKSNLKSPDSSFNGIVTLDVLDAAGTRLDAITLADVYGQRNWQSFGNPHEVAKWAYQVGFATGRSLGADAV